MNTQKTDTPDPSSEIKTVGLRELRYELGDYIDLVSRGKFIGIERHGKLMAVMVPPEVLKVGEEDNRIMESKTQLMELRQQMLEIPRETRESLMRLLRYIKEEE